MRVRGLKPGKARRGFFGIQSHPVRVRGLKPEGGGGGGGGNESHPVRVRGLKLDKLLKYGIFNHVAPRAGAWIETGRCRSK